MNAETPKIRLIMSKAKVTVALNREAALMAREKGMEAAKAEGLRRRKNPNAEEEPFHFSELEFNTLEEAKAYQKGVDDGNGWHQSYSSVEML